MKTKLSFLFLFVVLSATAVFSQDNNKAMMEYEDAETAYSNGNYRKTIEHLDNAERLLGTVTAKTEYLRIMSLDKLISPNNYQWADLEKLINSSKHYLETYTNADKDKYRDVYEISTKLKDYPKSHEAHQMMLDIKKENERKRQEEEQNRKRIEEEINIKKRQNFLSFNLFDFHEDGKHLKDYKPLLREETSFNGIYKIADDYEARFYYYGEYGCIYFNRNKISYRQEYYAIKTNDKKDFERKVNEFADKYAITPEKTDVSTYRFEYKNKVVLLKNYISINGSIKIIIVNRNYE